MIDAHTSPVPAVLEIPSKDHPYDASKDSILRRARVSLQIIKIKKCVIKVFFQGMFNPEDLVR